VELTEILSEKKLKTLANYQQGRAAQQNIHNRFSQQQYVQEHLEGIDDFHQETQATSFTQEYPKKIVNKVNSPDIPFQYSINPYQGCEHGCSYCYARPTHEYWGYSAGTDFEQKIIVKPTAPGLLRKQLDHPKWEPQPIVLSGNTDCYQPAEKKYQITRQLLEIMLEYKHPVGIITKNSLILRDIDLLRELAKDNLIRVNLSITTLNESLRRAMEPRTATAQKRLETLEQLATNNIPVHLMVAPVIPGLNNHEIPKIVKAAAERGAVSAGYSTVRLNGSVAQVFEHWIHQHFPDRAAKVLGQIKSMHGGELSNHAFGSRMRGNGRISEAIAQLFRVSTRKYMPKQSVPPLNTSAFKRKNGEQLALF